jgi:hypothetical protein
MAPFPMPDAQMLQAFYAHQTQMMMAQMAAAAPATRSPPAAAPPAAAASSATAAPVAAAAPVMVEEPAAPDPLKQSLQRMRASLDGSAAAVPAKVTSTVAPVIADAPPLAPEEADTGYDALGEIVDSAEAAKMRGRPVSILVLSAKDASFSAGVLDEVTHKLSMRGTVRRSALHATIRDAASIAGLVAPLSDSIDYLVIDGGHAGPGSAVLADAAVITILVAPDDVLDPANDVASRSLLGCSYFIVGPVKRVLEPA